MVLGEFIVNHAVGMGTNPIGNALPVYLEGPASAILVDLSLTPSRFCNFPVQVGYLVVFPLLPIRRGYAQSAQSQEYELPPSEIVKYKFWTPLIFALTLTACPSVVVVMSLLLKSACFISIGLPAFFPEFGSFWTLAKRFIKQQINKNMNDFRNGFVILSIPSS